MTRLLPSMASLRSSTVRLRLSKVHTFQRRERGPTALTTRAESTREGRRCSSANIVRGAPNLFVFLLKRGSNPSGIDLLFCRFLLCVLGGVCDQSSGRALSRAKAE